MATPPTGYQGNRDFTSDNDEFNVLSYLIKQILGRCSIATYVQVVAVYGPGDDSVAAQGFVDVLPLVKQIDGLRQIIPDKTPVFHLSYSRVQAGLNAIIMDPEVGDIGLCVFSDHDISTVIATGAEAAPGSNRRNDMADGTYVFMGSNAAAKVPTQYIQFLPAGGGINMKSPNNININGAVITPEGEVIAKFGTGASVTLTGHKHKQDADGHGDSEQDTHSPTGGT